LSYNVGLEADAPRRRDVPQSCNPHGPGDVSPLCAGPPERGLRSCALYRKVTNGFRAARAAAHDADVRSVFETPRRRRLSAIRAIRLTLAQQEMPLAA